MRQRFWLCLLALALLNGCADQPAQPGYTLPTPGKNSALVCFYRERKYQGSGIVYRIRETGREIGILPNGKFFYVYVPPGEHIFEAHGFISEPGRARLVAKPGRTYFVKADFSTGFYAAHLDLNIMNEDEGQSMTDRLRLKEPLAPR